MKPNEVEAEVLELLTLRLVDELEVELELELVDELEIEVELVDELELELELELVELEDELASFSWVVRTYKSFSFAPTAFSAVVRK
jgi:hypothetical protein